MVNIVVKKHIMRPFEARFLRENGVCGFFPKGAFKQAGRIKDPIRLELICRPQNYGCSVDAFPTGSRIRVIDDVFWVEKKEDHFLVKISVPDLCYFIPEGSVIDREARNRVCDLSPPNINQKMLPFRVVETASLVPGTKKLALTVEAKVGFDGEIQEVDIRKSTLLNFNALNLQAADHLRETGDSPIAESLRAAQELAMIREEVCGWGRFDLEQGVLEDRYGRKKRVAAYERTPSFSTVQQMNYLANEAVAIFMEDNDCPMLPEHRERGFANFTSPLRDARALINHYIVRRVLDRCAQIKDQEEKLRDYQEASQNYVRRAQDFLAEISRRREIEGVLADPKRLYRLKKNGLHRILRKVLRNYEYYGYDLRQNLLNAIRERRLSPLDLVGLLEAGRVYPSVRELLLGLFESRPSFYYLRAFRIMFDRNRWQNFRFHNLNEGMRLSVKRRGRIMTTQELAPPNSKNIAALLFLRDDFLGDLVPVK